MSGPIGYYSDGGFLHHDAGYGHPERPARLKAVEAALAADGFAASELRALRAPPADRADLERVHDPDYLDSVERLCSTGGGQLDPDTAVNEVSFTAATRA